MKRAFYSGDYQAIISKGITLDEALTDVADIAHELTRFPRGLSEFAYSMDEIDKWEAQAFRTAMGILAHQCIRGELSDNEIAQVHAALAFVCSGDEYASKEVAGRFMSFVRRTKVLAAIARHPRAGKFYTLTEAIGRGRFTKAQWTLAVKLASEAGYQQAA